MKNWVESSVFFRALNYLRIRHPYALRYNAIYPAVATGVVAIPMILGGDIGEHFKTAGFIPSLIPVLSILAPFYIASLAAVSTFAGPEFFDEPFRMNKPVTLQITGSGGDWIQIDVTPRYFLSLLFGYCSVASIGLLILTIFSNLIAKACTNMPWGLESWALGMLLILFIFALCQLVLSTLLGIYYLADRIHRK